MSLMGFYERNYLKILGAIALVGVGATVFFAGYVKGSPKSAHEVVNDISTSVEDTLTDALQQSAGTVPVDFLQPSRKPGTGVTVNTLPDNGDLILLTGFFDDDPGLRLIRRDGSVVAGWRAAFSDLLPERLNKRGAPETDWNIDLHGAQIEPDGSVVFNFEYQGTVKLDRCGKRLWSVEANNHHTLTPATGGGYWVGARKILPKPYDPAYFPIFAPDRQSGWIEDDEIMRISDDGKVLARKSVYELMMESGMEAVLTAANTSMLDSRPQDNEIMHLNMITELTPELAPAFPEFKAGDLALSIRDYNLVLVVDPQTWKVRWYNTGPWVWQHSVRFDPDGRISVFNNNAYEFEAFTDGKFNPDAKIPTNILAMDPQTRQTEVLYGDRPGEALNNVVRGFNQFLPDGGILITETQGGRAFQIDKDRKIVWEYINRFDDAQVIEMTSAEVHPAGYFKVKDWSCPVKGAGFASLSGTSN